MREKEGESKFNAFFSPDVMVSRATIRAITDMEHTPALCIYTPSTAAGGLKKNGNEIIKKIVCCVLFEKKKSFFKFIYFLFIGQVAHKRERAFGNLPGNQLIECINCNHMINRNMTQNSTIECDIHTKQLASLNVEKK